MQDLTPAYLLLVLDFHLSLKINLSMMKEGIRIGVDTGGTFNDFIISTKNKIEIKKIPSTHARSKRWIPMIFNKRRVILIIDDPFVAFSLSREELWEFFGPPYGREFGFVMATPSALDGVLEEKYPLESC